MFRCSSLIKIIFFITIFFLSGCVAQGVSVKADNAASRINSAEAYVTLGMEALEKQDVVKARQQLYHAYALAPRNADVLDSLAYFQEVTGELKNASQTYQSAISYNPHDGNANNDYGTFLCRHGNYQKAIQQFIVAAKKPTYLYVAAAYENAGLCAAMIPDQKMAETYLLRSVNEDPKRVMALFELSRLYFRNGNAAKSKQYYQRLVKLNKVKARDYMSLMLRKQANNTYEKINQNKSLPKNLQALKQIKQTPVQKRVRIKPSLALLPLPDTLNKKKISKVKIVRRPPPPPKKPIKKPEVPSAPKPPALKPVIKADTGGKQWQQVLSKEKSLIAHHESALPTP